MTKPSVFNKKYVEKDKMDDVEGLLEHFNLPPKFIAFVRHNVRLVQLIILVIVAAVVFGSLYSSYRDKQATESASALAIALEKDGAVQYAALENVVVNYKGSDAARWAKIEMGHAYMAEKKYPKAIEAYSSVLTEISPSNALYPVLLFGTAQALEGDTQYVEAFNKYDVLRELVGYKELAYLGMARTWEARGNIEKAILTYNDFLLNLEDKNSPSKAYVESKIIRLQAKQ